MDLFSSTQTIFGDAGEEPLVLPPPDSEVMPGVPWGIAGAPFTPAYWKAISFMNRTSPAHYRLGSSLLEEAAACLLGGYGIPAEVGLAAYERLRREGLLNSRATLEQIEDALERPLEVGARVVRYRFAATKAKALYRLCQDLSPAGAPSEPIALRSHLMAFSGFGPKTASWVVRNFCDSDAVAILDVHLIRAMQLIGVFPEDVRLPRDYFRLEAHYLSFSASLDVRPAVLDALIWAQMKKYGSQARAAAKASELDGPHRHRRPVATTERVAKSRVLP